MLGEKGPGINQFGKWCVQHHLLRNSKCLISLTLKVLKSLEVKKSCKHYLTHSQTYMGKKHFCVCVSMLPSF